MITIKTLFADDESSRFDSFTRRVMPQLKGMGIELAPLDHAVAWRPHPSIPGQSVRERIASAATESQSYELVISDLVFKKGIVPGGDRDGFYILQEASQANPLSELVLLTSHSKAVEPEEVVQLSQGVWRPIARWCDMGGEVEGSWNNLTLAIKHACEIIEERRKAIAEPPIPPRYEVRVLQDTLATEPVHSKKTLTVDIRDLTDSSKSAMLTLKGDMAVLFQAIGSNKGRPVNREDQTEAINRMRRPLVADVLDWQRKALDGYLQAFYIDLIGEQEGAARGCCTRKNDLLCAWGRSGAIEPTEGEEGYTCFQETAYIEDRQIGPGYCPKRLFERIPDARVEIRESSIGNFLRDLRDNHLKPLEVIFGSGFGGDSGILTTLPRRGGVAAAAIWVDAIIQKEATVS